MLDTDLVTAPPSLCDRVDRDGFTQLNQPASARPLRPRSAAHIFAQLLVFIFLSVLLVRLIALLESLEARTCISLQVLLAALLLLFCSPCICVWPSDEPGLPGATLFTSARHSQRQNGGRRIERSHRRDVDVHGAEATRRRSRTVKTTGNIPGNAPSRCWEAHVQHEHAVPVLDLGAQVPTA